jgi:hypothetical protein
MFPHTAHVESMAVFEWDPSWQPSEDASLDLGEPVGTDAAASSLDDAEVGLPSA